MENKLNIAELLKDCPKGMELYSPIFGEVYLDKIRPHLAIVVTTDKEQGDFKEEFLYDGRYGMNGECMLFPSKGKTSWEGFQGPFKDGDIIAEDDGRICIYKNDGKIKNTANYYCGILSSGDFRIKDEKYPTRHFGPIEYYHLATEEKRQRLFEAIKVNGFRWNAETKTLEKLVNPNFKVGNKIVRKGRKGIDYPIEVLAIENGRYKLPAMSMPIDSQDEWELVSDKFDITTLKPFGEVLVRDNDEQTWRISFFGHCNGLETYKYSCINGSGYSQCIPYEGNEHLIGVINNCSDFYKTWENDY